LENPEVKVTLPNAKKPCPTAIPLFRPPQITAIKFEKNCIFGRKAGALVPTPTPTPTPSIVGTWQSKSPERQRMVIRDDGTFSLSGYIDQRVFVRSLDGHVETRSYFEQTGRNVIYAVGGYFWVDVGVEDTFPPDHLLRGRETCYIQGWIRFLLSADGLDLRIEDLWGNHWCQIDGHRFYIRHLFSSSYQRESPRN
jgi:hypothetical protein